MHLAWTKHKKTLTSGKVKQVPPMRAPSTTSSGTSVCSPHSSTVIRRTEIVVHVYCTPFEDKNLALQFLGFSVTLSIMH